MPILIHLACLKGNNFVANVVFPAGPLRESMERPSMQFYSKP